ncbi:hypothetical protein BCR36DRAFT_585684 [Piromyces finnis]|uniref:Uncharacterized protein n=1 Tax=Piromyces finnis TaxID=1754191 RepID=A0A1Y1V3Y2_9FUNG|nr:hypothetical protein BCR36DRAFT_585684 [Piromyces finnis]|eukprot:ORX45377.1 hypothetical protein BCR36DRAFT_585684 [Piromyces finnis]
MATQDNTNNRVEEATQKKPNNGGGFFGFFKSKKTDVEPVNEIKVEQPTEPNTVPTSRIETDTEPINENITIKVEPSSATTKPTINKPIRLNDIDLYEDEPSLRDIPLDIYDDSIKLEPQNPKYNKYQSIENTDMETNLNSINLYESTPESKKTIFRKIKEIINETIRLIKVGINAIFAFIWSIIGGTVTSIFVFFRKMCFSILLSVIKSMFTSNKKNDTKDIIRGVADAKDVIDDIWDVNKMVVTTPMYESV